MFHTRKKIYKRNLFYENDIVYDSGSPERCNFSEKKKDVQSAIGPGTDTM